MILINFQP